MSVHSSTKRSRRRDNRQKRPDKRQDPGQLAAGQRRPISNFWIHAALLLTTVLVYSSVREFDFVNYDDPQYVTDNVHVRAGLTAEGLRWAATAREAANWFPLTRMSHMLDVQLFGLDAGLHHLMNLFFHALATLFLFAFFERVTRARWPSAFVAFIFAMHPLHVESVAWIAERKDVLSAFFWIFSLWLYARYTERAIWSRYLLVLLSFSCGLLAKPMIVTLPFILLLLDFWPLRRLPSSREAALRIVAEKVPFFALSAAVSAITYFAQQGSRAIKAFPIGLRVENALVSYVTYIGKMFWPVDLAVFYPYPHSVPAGEAVFAGFVLLTVSMLVLRAVRSHAYLAVGWFWYMGTLLPVIGFIQVGAQARADRYTYIPMIGLLIMLAWGALEIVARWPRTKGVAVLAAGAACASCALLTSLQLQYWRNSETLFGHALAVTRDNYVAQHNFGLAIVDQPGRLAEAMAHYRAALQIQPQSVETRSDLGSALAKSGDLKDAIAEYQTALAIAPDCTICRSNLNLAETQLANEFFTSGVALAKSGRTHEAVDQFEAALRLAPEDAEAHNNLGVALATLGRSADAIREFQIAVRIKPDYSDARYNLAAALEEAKQKQN